MVNEINMIRPELESQKPRKPKKEIISAPRYKNSESNFEVNRAPTKRPTDIPPTIVVLASFFIAVVAAAVAPLI